jgi:hypothetical protein
VSLCYIHIDFLPTLTFQHVTFDVDINISTPLLEPCNAKIKFPQISEIHIRKFYLVNKDILGILNIRSPKQQIKRRINSR